MKKFFAIALLTLTLAFTGCSGADTPDITSDSNITQADAPKEVNAASVADSLKSEGSFKDTLGDVDAAIAINKLYDLDESKIDDSAFYTNTNATAEEIAVVTVSDSAYTDTVKAAFETRVADQKEACKDYLPDEMPKLDSAVIRVEGNTVILCISADSSAANKIIDNIFSK